MPWKGFEPGSSCSRGGYDVQCATPPGLKTVTFAAPLDVVNGRTNGYDQNGGEQGCQMVYFQTKIPIWVIFRALQWKATRSILRAFGIICIWPLRYVLYVFACYLTYTFPVLVSITEKNLASLAESRF
jgi:hypothetical protein